MTKRPNESWLFYLARLVGDLVRDDDDRKYWAGIFGMAGAASLAVASIEGNAIAFYSGVIFCLYGLKFNRKR